ncbi:MAG TPA: hypothetical protein VGP46_03960 [Acidimicrobiales bacterium]|nr:hypothetical protein [Acidimicrobiales bacterium]
MFPMMMADLGQARRNDLDRQLEQSLLARSERAAAPTAKAMSWLLAALHDARRPATEPAAGEPRLALHGHVVLLGHESRARAERSQCDGGCEAVAG